MTDRPLDVLRDLEIAATPNAGFAEGLHARLVPMVTAARRADRSPLRSIIRILAGRPSPNVSPQLRLAISFAVLAALLLAATAVWLGSRRPDPAQLVTESELVYRQPPAFDMTVAYDDGTVRRWRFDGAGILRLDLVSGWYLGRPAGAIVVNDGARNQRVEIDPSGTASILEIPLPLAPLSELDLRWGGEGKQGSGRTSAVCQRWLLIGEDVVGGRPTTRVRCERSASPIPPADYWLDDETHLILQSTVVAATDPEWTGGGDWMSGHATSLVLGRPGNLRPELAATDPWLGEQMTGGNAALEAGLRYVTNRFVSPFAVTIEDEGWRSWGTDVDIVGFQRGTEPHTDGALVFVERITRIGNPQSGRDETLAPGAASVLDWLRGHPSFAAEEAAAVTVGGREAAAITIREHLPANFDATCPQAQATGDPPPCRRWFAAGTGWWTLGGNDADRFTVASLDDGADTLTFFILASGSAAAEHEGAARRLLETLELLD